MRRARSRAPFSAKVGRFELASGGTLFLDEIGDMPLAMQVKVLRALQDKAFERVGGVETRHADVRILAATHRDLQEMIARETFREDLFYRLNVFPIEMDTSAGSRRRSAAAGAGDRREDPAEQGIRVRLTVDALQTLADTPGPVMSANWPTCWNDWPFSIPMNWWRPAICRLRMSRVRCCSFESVTRCQLEPATSQPSEDLEDSTDPVARLPVNGLDLKNYLARLECSLIEQALEDTNSVVARAADRLHIRRTTLVEKMRKYGIERA